MVERLIASELTSGECLLSVNVSRIQGAPWDWILFSLLPVADHSVLTVLSTLAPFREGEFLLPPWPTSGFVAPRDFLTADLSWDDARLAQYLSQSPPEVREVVGRAADETHTPVLFARLRRDGSLSDAQTLSQRIAPQTWLGFRALPPRLRSRQIDLRLGAQRVRLAPPGGRSIATTETGCAHVTLFPAATASSKVTCRTLSGDGTIRTIAVPATVVAEALGVPLNSYYGFRVELPIELEIVSTVACENGHDVVGVLTSGAAGLQPAREYCLQSIEDGVDETIRRLDLRRRRIQSRDSILVQEPGGAARILGVVPTNEHEVLILTGKLETYIDQVLPVFRILEHTSQAGIDALADVQLSRDTNVARGATLEFEYVLGNFFRHSHPIRQTEFIVCWCLGGIENGTHRYGDGAIDRDGRLEFRMSGQSWVRVLDFGDHLIHTLVLESLPVLATVSARDARRTAQI